MIAATVHPMPGRKITGPLPPPQQGRVPDPAARLPISEIPPPVRPAHSWLGPEGIEPRRKHRIARERDPIGARIDLHGYDQDRARPALDAFVRRAWDEGYRAVLVVTGKGAMPGLTGIELCRAMHATRPDLIINPAAYTAVDKAEQEPNLARAINTLPS